MKLSYEAVRSIFRECGPMTMREVALFFPDVPYNNVGSVISGLRIKHSQKQLYIYSWTREGIGKKYLRAVYAIGNKRDATKPPVISDKDRSKEWRARHKVPQVVANSVFTWGQHEQR